MRRYLLMVSKLKNIKIDLTQVLLAILTIGCTFLLASLNWNMLNLTDSTKGIRMEMDKSRMITIENTRAVILLANNQKHLIEKIDSIKTAQDHLSRKVAENCTEMDKISYWTQLHRQKYSTEEMVD